MASVVAQWLGHYQQGGSDKVWAAAYYDDGYYEAVWGRRGRDPSRQGHNLSVAEASELFTKKVRDKQREGYQTAAFDSPYYGIASFPPRGGAVAVAQVTPVTNRAAPNAQNAIPIVAPQAARSVPTSALPVVPSERQQRMLEVATGDQTVTERGERAEL